MQKVVGLPTKINDFPGKGTIPVIMEAAYTGTFFLGDRFEGYYICDRFTFEVTGFAESGWAFYSGGDGRPVSYDRYIIMPFAFISEDSEISRIILLQQFCGLITDENGRDDALRASFEASLIMTFPSVRGAFFSGSPKKPGP